MVSYFGMSPAVGHLSFYDSQDAGYNFNKPYSEKTAELIDAEAKALIVRAHEKAREILLAHKEGFTRLAELLLEKEVIFTEDMERIFGPRIKELPKAADPAPALPDGGAGEPVPEESTPLPQADQSPESSADIPE